MKSFPRFTASFVGFASLLIGCSLLLAQDLKSPTIREAIKAPPTEKLLLTVLAKGVPIYEWRTGKDDPNKFE